MTFTHCRTSSRILTLNLNLHSTHSTKRYAPFWTIQWKSVTWIPCKTDCNWLSSFWGYDSLRMHSSLLSAHWLRYFLFFFPSFYFLSLSSFLFICWNSGLCGYGSTISLFVAHAYMWPAYNLTCDHLHDYTRLNTYVCTTCLTHCNFSIMSNVTAYSSLEFPVQILKLWWNCDAMNPP